MSKLPPLPERDSSKPAEQQGIFRKFDVRRTDGSSEPGGKHHDCEYFVLDVDHDPAARAALKAYADAVEATHPELAADMRNRYALEFARAIEAAATEPLLQRIAELEQRNSDLHEDVQRFRKHAMNEKAARMELERQLEEARKDADRWKMTIEISQDVLRHPDCRKIPSSVSAYMYALHKGYDMTYAVDAAIDAMQKGQS